MFARSCRPLRREFPLPLLLALVVAISSQGRAEDVSSQFVVPPGFEVSLHAGDDLAHDIFCMTLDSRGQAVVSGKGYVKRLIDADGDGLAERAQTICTWPPGGAHGLLFDGEDLLVSTGTGLYRLRDADGDGVADGKPVRLAPSRGGGDHSSNGIVLGPDGHYWWIHGNDAGVGPEHIRSSRSPIREVNCGAVVRMSRDGTSSEVHAHGFRNPYDLAFGPSGHLFTYDADGERDQYLPWYSPTRIFDVARGQHHGWVLKGWKHAWNHSDTPFDSVDRLAEVGRGSPTGVAVYRHHRFPAHYHGNVLAMCWSQGRIYHLPLRRNGSTFATDPEIFLQTRGNVGFAPVDLEVTPEGDLLVAIGGRGTRGSVFRVRHEKGGSAPAPEKLGPLSSVLRAPQPLSAWSRARWTPGARELGSAAFREAALDSRRPLAERLRALEILVDTFEARDRETFLALLEDADPAMARRAIWALEQDEHPTRRTAIARATGRGDPGILRAAWEAIATWSEKPRDTESLEPSWLKGLAHEDRRVRAATVLAARSPVGRELFERAIDPEELDAPAHLLGWLRVHLPRRGESPARAEPWFARLLEALEKSRDRVQVIEALRVLQRGLGDVHLVQDRARVTDGYLAARPEAAPAPLREELIEVVERRFPSGDEELDLELMRTLAFLEAPGSRALGALPALWTADSRVETDIHHLLAAGRLRGPAPEGFASAAARALVALPIKMQARGLEPSRYWPLRVQAAFRQLTTLAPDLGAAMVQSPEFGLPEHLLFVSVLEDADLARRATIRLLDRAIETGRFTGELVARVSQLDDPRAPAALRKIAGDPAHRDSVVLALARPGRAGPQDRELFLEALESHRPEVVATAARALTSWPGAFEDEDLVPVLTALERQCAFPGRRAARQALTQLLGTVTGENIEIVEPEKGVGLREAYRPWRDWFQQAHPGLADLLPESRDESLGTWIDRIVGLDGSGASAERGEKVFRARGCESCHRGASRIGPSLEGVARRLSVRDLLVAIADPDRDISEAYVATEVITRDGQIHRGLMIYASPAATIMQTGPDTSVRFSAADVLRRRKSDSSFMPTGLLEGASDAEVLDLLAYLAASP